MQRLRMAVVGLGALGRELVEQSRNLEQVEMVALCDEDLDRARTVASQTQVTAFYDSHRELLQDASPQAVVIATPPHTHKELALDVIHAGAHLLVEKPLALKLSECDAILTAAARAEVQLMVGSRKRFQAVFQAMKERAERGSLGDLRFLHAVRFWGARQEFSGWRMRYRSAAGGLYPVYLEEVDLLLWLGGEVRAVQANLTRGAFEPIEVEDAISILIEFQSGALGTLTAGQLYAAGAYDFSAAGSRASLRWGGDERTLISSTHAGVEETLILPDTRAIRAQLLEFTDSIHRQRPPLITGLDGKKALEVVLAAYRSAETGQRVHLPIG